MRYAILGFVLVVITGCTCCGLDFWNTEPTTVSIKKRIDSQTATNIIIEYSQKLERDHHLFLEDSSFWYDKEVISIELEYSTQDLLTVKEARRILVEMVEDLMERLNEDASISDSLKYPFKAKRLQIYIDCQSFFGLYVDPFYISWIILEDGKSYFYAFDLKFHGYDFWHSRIEPYFKSAQIIHAEDRANELYEASKPAVTSNLSKDRYLGQKDQNQDQNANVNYNTNVNQNSNVNVNINP